MDISLGMSSAWLLPVLCVAAFVIVTFWGRQLPGKGAFIAIGTIGLGFVIFWFVLRDLLFAGPKDFSTLWFYVGDYDLRIGMIVDELSVMMLGVVTFVALLVQVYSLGYMHGDSRFGWYFAAHSLFAASMLGLVLADNFLLLYITWELVGLCSYLLIGFWYERRSAAEAAKKAFVTTRIGDVGLLIGILMLFKATGTFGMREIFEAAAQGHIDAGTLTWASILIFAGAMGKSAQFPLHVWLPDAMEGPTPVSALIHAATMVAAGVYLVARTFPLFEVAQGALQFVSIIGLITALMAGTMAIVMNDIKKVIAYSTVSKLGFMMLALGSGGIGLTAGIFYLMTHAFFKALLFLGAGSVIHSTGTQDIWKMGGLAKKMPLTALTFIVASLSLAGIPPLAGFWSKDEVLLAIREGQSPIIFILAVVVALLGAIYSGRLMFVVFFGKPRDQHVHEHAHESPRVMTWPLLALAVPAALAGFFILNQFGGIFGLPEKYQGFGTFIFPEGHPELYHVDVALMVLSIVVAVLGIAIAWAFYSARIWSAEGLSRALEPLHTLFVNKYYLDDLYQWTIDHVVLVLAGFIAVFDRRVINDTGVNGPAEVTVFLGDRLKYHITGKMYNYGFAMAIGIVIIILAASFRG